MTQQSTDQAAGDAHSPAVKDSVSTGLVQPTDPSRMRRLRRFPDWILALTGFALVGAAWQFLAEVVVGNQLLFASFTDTAAATVDLFATGEIWPHLSISSQAFVVGYVAAAVTGIVVGAVFASSDTLNRMFRNVVQAGYATPLVAIAPLMIVLFGVGLFSKVVVVFILAIFPVMIATQTALNSIDPSYLETSRAFGASRWQTLRMVVFPAAAVGVMAGLRLAVGRGIIGVVVGEFFGARGGLGFLLVQYSMAFQTAKTLSVVVLLATIGVTTNQLLLRLEERWSPWKGSNGSGKR